MLLQGAYSAKYRAAHQETVENLRDEERQEFNVKLEKNKELSRDTNRRRRALEQRRKDYEAEEERKRREILAQRKKQIQEATEKFQRANFVRSRKKTKNHYLDRSKANKKVKHENTEPGLVTKHTKSEVNGQPYYPSVEEVLAMLHADRADVIERLVSGETHDHLRPRDYDYTPERTDDFRPGSPREGQSPVPYYNTNESAGSTEGTKVTPEQQIIDQEKLRSEVVGRTQPRVAFGDGTKDITEGVLPTTIRRNSPSGSLSSLDSLDEVPDEVLEPAGAEPVPDVMENQLEGIIRRAGKIKSGSRVTFNESVIFSDGLVGTLKKKQEIAHDVSDAFGIEKQNSYFKIMEQQTSHEKIDNETPGMELPKYLDTNANVIVSKCLQDTPVSRCPPETSTQSTTVVNKYTISTADVTPGSVTNYSKTNGGLTNGGTSSVSEIKNLVTTPVRNSDSLRRGQCCVPRDVGEEHNSYTCQMAVRKSPVTSENAVGDNTRETVNAVENGEKLSAQNLVHGVQTHGELNGFHPERQSNAEDGKTTATRVPFSSINGSMLRDSLEMSYRSTTSSQSQSSTDPAHTPSVESRMRGTGDAEALPETPLIPVTKKDFLSKALLRATNNAHDDLKSRTGLNNPKQWEGVKSGYNTNGMLHNGHHFTGNVVPNASETARLNGYKSDVYHQGTEYGTRNSSGIQGHNGTTGVLPSASEAAKRNGYESDMYKQGYQYGVRDSHSGGIQPHNGTNGVPNGNDAINHNGYESDMHKQGYGARNIREVQGHNGITGVSNGIDATKHNGYESDMYKQRYEYGTRGTQGHGGIKGNNSSKTSPKSRLVGGTSNKEPLTNGQSQSLQPKARSPAWHRSAVKNVQEDRISTATRKGNSTDDLLKSVQEDIERISMLPAQQNASSAYTDQGTVPFVNYKSRRKPTVSDQGRKPTKKKSPNGAKEGNKRFNSTTKRLHKPSGETGSGTRKQATSAINIQYASSPPNDNQDYSSNANLSSKQNHSTFQDISSRLPDKGDAYSETRPLEYYSHREPPWATTFEKKQQRNREGLELLDKTPTDEEINTLWETVRTCLKHEQSHKAASDSIVNNIRHSRSESGPLVGNHYLIDNNRWGPTPRIVTNAFGLNSTGSEPRQTTVSGRVAFRRQNSVDGFERRGSSDSTASLPVRKGSLLEHRKHKTERRLPRTQQSSRPPLYPQSFQARRGPVASASGPQKSNTVKAEETKRPHLSYAEFQAVMQASADLQTRNNEGETQRRPQQALHQPIIMNYRKEPSALSLEEKRLLESLDRLNERLKVQEGFSGKLTKGQINPNIQTSPSKFVHASPSNSRFGSNRNSGHKSLATSPSLLNRR